MIILIIQFFLNIILYRWIKVLFSRLCIVFEYVHLFRSEARWRQNWTNFYHFKFENNTYLRWIICINMINTYIILNLKLNWILMSNEYFCGLLYIIHVQQTFIFFLFQLHISWVNYVIADVKSCYIICMVITTHTWFML